MEDVVEKIGFKLLSNAKLADSVVESFSRKDFSLVLYDVIENLKDTINVKKCETEISQVDKTFVEKLHRMYEDSKFKPDPFSDSQHVVDSLNDKTASDGIILKQMKSIRDRDLDAALKSLELSFVDGENFLNHRIENGAKALETCIPKLQSKLDKCHKEFVDAHDSENVLNSAIYANYCVLRDGYVNLMRKHYSESIAQLKITTDLEKQTHNWFDTEMRQISSEPRAVGGGESLRSRTQQVMEQTQTQFAHACDSTFQHLLRNNDFDESEHEFAELQSVQCLASKWKANIAAHSEELLLRAVEADTAAYLTLVEELHERLAKVRATSSELFFYGKSLQKQTKLLSQIEAQERRKHESLAGKLSVARHEHFHHADNPLSIDMNVKRALEIENHALCLGTSLRAQCVSLQMSAEEVEEVLLQMLP